MHELNALFTSKISTKGEKHSNGAPCKHLAMIC